MDHAVPELSAWESVLRVVVAGVLGGMVGFEREFGDQPAGFRTHILVALGSALFTVAGAFGVGAFVEGGPLVRFDPTRVAAQVVTGIGFLGAGAILRQGLTVRGLTTAAALWVTAAIGVAVGLGYWIAGLVTTLVALLALYGLKTVERAVFPRLRRGRHEYTIDMTEELRMAELAQLVESHRARLDSLRIVQLPDGGRHLVARVVLPPHLTPEVLAEEINRLEGVVEVEWRD